MSLSKQFNFRKRVKITSGVSAIALALSFFGASQAVAQMASDSATPSATDFTKTRDDNSNWILTAKNYSNDRYVDQTSITPANVKDLKPVWTFKVDDNGPIEAQPLIWHGTAYLTSAHDHVYAIDVKTGKLKWEFQDSPHVIAFAANRGVALLDGKVYVATLDGHLIALDAESGKKVFDVVGVSDTTNAFYTAAPLPYYNAATGKSELLLGVANGDWGGLGNISAFDPADGHRIWQFNTVPGVGEKGNSTWSGDSRSGMVPNP